METAFWRETSELIATRPRPLQLLQESNVYLLCIPIVEMSRTSLGGAALEAHHIKVKGRDYRWLSGGEKFWADMSVLLFLLGYDKTRKEQQSVRNRICKLPSGK